MTLLQIVIKSDDSSSFYNTNLTGVHNVTLKKISYLQNDTTDRIVRIYSPQLRVNAGNKQFIYFTSMSDNTVSLDFTIDFSSPLSIVIDNAVTTGTQPTSFSYCVLYFEVQNSTHQSS